MQESLTQPLDREDPLETGKLPIPGFLKFPGGLRICLQCRRPGFDPWIGKIAWRRERLPSPVFWPGEFHGLYNPWCRKESDMTERLTFHFPKK